LVDLGVDGRMILKYILKDIVEAAERSPCGSGWNPKTWSVSEAMILRVS
jgi:hypothetical protein